MPKPHVMQFTVYVKEVDTFPPKTNNTLNQQSPLTQTLDGIIRTTTTTTTPSQFEFQIQILDGAQHWVVRLTHWVLFVITSTTTGIVTAAVAKSFEVPCHQLAELLQKHTNLRIVLELSLRLFGILLQQLHGRHALGILEAIAHDFVGLEVADQIGGHPVYSVKK